MKEPRNIPLLPPTRLTGIKIGKVPKKAAGLKAVGSAMRHLSEELGLFSGLQLMTKVNQAGGVDCPGCAWPDPKSRSKLFEYCENGAKAIAEEATSKRVNAEFFKKHSIAHLATWSDYELGKVGRLTHPFFLAEGSDHYEAISWEEAFQKIAEKLKRIRQDQAVFYTSGRTSNESAFLYQLLVRKYGTNNMPDCSNMCHESSGVGLGETLGIGKGSVTLEDIYEAEAILVMGQNPGTNHPRMLSALQKCKARGGKIIHVNPLPEVGSERFVDPQSPLQILQGGTKIADHFLQVRINGDVALLKLLMLGLFEAEERTPGKVLDREFILQHTDGFDAFREALMKTDKEAAHRACGLSAAQLKPVIQLLAEKRKIIICWAMGITQHRNGVDNVREIVNLLMLKGSIGKPGAGTCPVRGHSNVQGDRTMGIYEKPSASFLDALESTFQFKAPREHGFDTVDSIKAMAAGKVEFFMGMGGNFISATPDSEATARAMQNCSLTVQVSTKLNRGHIVTGAEALILPCLARTEADVQNDRLQFMTVENSMGVVHKTQGVRLPASPQLKSEVAIVCGLASALFGPNDSVKWTALEEDYDLIRDQIASTIPGFEDFNRKVRRPAGFDLPNGARERKFDTEKGKALFSVVEVPEVDPKEARFVMMTIRSHDQYNTTIYGLNDRYRGFRNERRVVLIHQEDLDSLGMAKGDLADLVSRFQGEERRSQAYHLLPFDVPRGCIATYFPEANALVPLNNVAKDSNTPASKFIEVDILPHDEAFGEVNY